MNEITTSDDNNTITIKLSGKAYETLQRMADALNEWSANGEDERDNTPLTVFDNFFCWELELLAYPTDETCSMVVDGIETGANDPAEERRLQDELNGLMQKHGIPTWKDTQAAISAILAKKDPQHSPSMLDIVNKKA